MEGVTSRRRNNRASTDEHATRHVICRVALHRSSVPRRRRVQVIPDGPPALTIDTEISSKISGKFIEDLALEPYPLLIGGLMSRFTGASSKASCKSGSSGMRHLASHPYRGPLPTCIETSPPNSCDIALKSQVTRSWRYPTDRRVRVGRLYLKSACQLRSCRRSATTHLCPVMTRGRYR